MHTTPFEDGSSNHAQTIERDGVQLMTVGGQVTQEVTPKEARPAIFGKVRLAMTHTCRHDDPDGRDGGLSLDSCLRAFERSRDFYGSTTSALLADGISVVVAGVDGLRHATVPANIGDTVEVIADDVLGEDRIVFDQWVSK